MVVGFDHTLKEEGLGPGWACVQDFGGWVAGCTRVVCVSTFIGEEGDHL